MRYAVFMVLTSLLLFGGADLFAEEAPAAAADPRFEFLAGLVGTWVGEAPHEGMPPAVIEFRLTAGGTAVEEREFAGTPMEMVTLYHMDGPDLVATHYCMLGNQPHLKAAKEVVERGLSFGCDGKPGNTASHDEAHIHGWSMRLDADGRLIYAAEMVKDGEVAEAPSFVLTRKSEAAGS